MLPSTAVITKEASVNLAAALSPLFDGSEYREVRAQLIDGEPGEPDHALVYLLSKRFHKVDFAAVELDAQHHPRSVQWNYRLEPTDLKGQRTHMAPACPDPAVQFIAFAPNDDDLEQQVTKGVAAYAVSHNLKTVSLLKSEATRDAYLNYMSCPGLVGNFYDGDADPTVITTADGVLPAGSFQTELKGQFRLKVTNIWLACEAYNDPMLSAVVTDAKAQKYAAGVNDLEVGPSDRTAACAMEAAIAGQPMTKAFQDCQKTDDTPADNWGFGGQGADNFGQ